MNLPPTWDKMGFVAKAGYLCAVGAARTYEEACAMLAKHRRKRATPRQTARANKEASAHIAEMERRGLW